MPDPSTNAPRALTHTDRPNRAGIAFRVLLGAVFAFSAMAIPEVLSPEPVAAGSSCTGWTSITKPPRTIKVLNSRSGTVEKVTFRKYVARVMASGEWPDKLKTATLQAGAVVTKQYAWYYAMKGNHRAHYRYNGECYDVRDDTGDQLYKSYKQPSARHVKAVSKTWGLTLRKQGRFVLTGYRAGISSTCAADANGWKLYAKSVEACAKKGWGYKRILKTYMEGNLRLVWSDQVGPTVSKPRVALKAGNDLASGATTVSWKPQLRKAVVARFHLQRKVSGSGWKNVKLPKPTVRQTDAWVKVDGKSRFRVRAMDSKGNWGYWSYSPGRKAALRRPARLASATSATSAGRAQKVKTRIKGRSVALVMRTGPGMGKIKVFVDGKRAAIVDLERPNVTPRKLVYAKNWARSGSHSIAFKPVAAGERVNFNSFFILR